MRSAKTDVLSPRIRRSLTKFGRDIGIARRRRRLTVAMMAERLGISNVTYLKVEKGDPSVGMAAYAMALFVLGLGTPFENLVDPRRDDAAALLDTERLPQRVRVKREPQPK